MGRMPSNVVATRHKPRLTTSLIYTPPLVGVDTHCRDYRRKAISEGVEFVVRLAYEHLTRPAQIKYDQARSKHKVQFNEHDIREPNWWIMADRLTIHLDDHEYVLKWLYKPDPEC